MNQIICGDARKALPRLQEDTVANERLIALSHDTGVPLVATNDVHYLNQDHWQAHDCLICIGTQALRDDPKRLRYQQAQFYLRSAEEMTALFHEVPQAVRNTLEVAEKVQFGFGETRNIFPDFQVPEGYQLDTYFEKVARDGFRVRAEHLRKLQAAGKLRHSIEDYEKCNEIIKSR